MWIYLTDKTPSILSSKVTNIENKLKRFVSERINNVWRFEAVLLPIK